LAKKDIGLGDGREKEEREEKDHLVHVER